jgi:uncharacterized damage-inducible protein DinB
MPAAIEGFRRHWEFVHAMTLDFANEVPDASWEYSPHPRFAPVCKQLRHVVCVRSLYNETLTVGKADWAKKHDHYTGGLSRDELARALIQKHDDLLAILDRSDDTLVVEFIGRPYNFAEFAHVMVQHEAIHQGQWSLYASLAGFETPLRWRLNWGL